MRWHKCLLVFLLAPLLVSGCAGGMDHEYVNAGPVRPYQLNSGDRLRIIVFGQDSLSGNYALDGSGRISIPLIPSVEAKGLTTQQLEARLIEVLSVRLLRDPSVSVEVLEFRPFFILGEVTSPGQYPYVNGMSVMTAVAIAGGFTYRASTGRAEIVRVENGAKVKRKLPIEGTVLPGDTIFISERFF